MLLELFSGVGRISEAFRPILSYVMGASVHMSLAYYEDPEVRGRWNLRSCLVQGLLL